MDLTRVDLVADLTEATYVAFGVRELAQRLGESATLHDGWSTDLTDHHGALILVGNRTIEAAGLDPVATTNDPGPEGYVLKRTRVAGRDTLLIAGSDPPGTKFGLLAALRMISPDRSTMRVADARTRPAFRLRAMYGHLHWSYNWPYALRRWTLDDWTGYVDHLSHLGANVLSIWPMLAMRPQPLSADDESTLRMFADVVEYATTFRGMEVWIGENSNNLASSDLGQPMVDRSYFGTQRLVDPASPEGIDEILTSRKSMFELMPGISGHWLCDSDPGHWPGSPSSDFVDIVGRTQTLVRSFNPEARTVYWAHVGWGTGSREENYRDVMSGLRGRLTEPWDMLVGTFPEHVEVAKELGLMEHAIWLPYGWGEGEPTPPLTLVRLEDSRAEFDKALELGLDRAMAQAQTPIVQLPRIVALMRWMWDPDRRLDEQSQLTDDLALMLFPEASDVVSAAWRALAGSDPAALQHAVSELDRALSDGLGAPGELARGLPGGHDAIAEDLLHVLTIRWKAVAFLTAVENGAPPEVVRDEVAEYIRSTLRWQRRTGYVPMGGAKYLYGDYLTPARAAWDLYVKKYGVMRAYPEALWIPKTEVIDEGEFHWALVDGVLNEITAVEKVIEL